MCGGIRVCFFLAGGVVAVHGGRGGVGVLLVDQIFGGVVGDSDFRSKIDADSVSSAFGFEN